MRAFPYGLLALVVMITLSGCEKTKEPYSFGDSSNTAMPKADNVQSGAFRAPASQSPAN